MGRSPRGRDPAPAEPRRRLAECPYTPERLAQILNSPPSSMKHASPAAGPSPTSPSSSAKTSPATPTSARLRPDGWTTLVQHLRKQASPTTDAHRKRRQPRLDRTPHRPLPRRVVFPIAHQGQVLGFVARRNPEHTDDDRRGPKYLNTSETPLFHKGAQLYLSTSDSEAVPVLVEGPMDAIAITLATRGEFAGVAPLGTSLTEAQAAQLLATSPEPVIATDADAAGRAAAERDYWLLAALHGEPRFASLPESDDPASMVADGASAQLCGALSHAAPLSTALLLDQPGEGPEPALDAIRILAASPPHHWNADALLISDRYDIPPGIVLSALASMVTAINAEGTTRQPLRHPDLRLAPPTERNRRDETTTSPTVGIAESRTAGARLRTVLRNIRRW